MDQVDTLIRHIQTLANIPVPKAHIVQVARLRSGLGIQNQRWLALHSKHVPILAAPGQIHVPAPTTTGEIQDMLNMLKLLRMEIWQKVTLPLEALVYSVQHYHAGWIRQIEEMRWGWGMVIEHAIRRRSHHALFLSARAFVRFTRFSNTQSVPLRVPGTIRLLLRLFRHHPVSSGGR